MCSEPWWIMSNAVQNWWKNWKFSTYDPPWLFRVVINFRWEMGCCGKNPNPPRGLDTHLVGVGAVSFQEGAIVSCSSNFSSSHQGFTDQTSTHAWTDLGEPFMIWKRGKTYTTIDKMLEVVLYMISITWSGGRFFMILLNVAWDFTVDWNMMNIVLFSCLFFLLYGIILWYCGICIDDAHIITCRREKTKLRTTYWISSAVVVHSYHQP